MPLECERVSSDIGAQLCEVLLPHPAYSTGVVILIPGKPKLAFGPDNIEDLQKVKSANVYHMVV